MPSYHLFSIHLFGCLQHIFEDSTRRQPVFSSLYYRQISLPHITQQYQSLDTLWDMIMIVQGLWLTSKWEWRYPRCLGWPAKETRLPARHPPLKKPWCRCAHSLRPHHSPHFYYLHQTDTNRISTWKHHSVALPMTTEFAYALETKRRHSRDVLHAEGLREQYDGTITPKIHEYIPKKMATFKYNDQTHLTSPPWITVIFINFHVLIID